MSLTLIRKHAIFAVSQYPKLKEEVADLLSLAESEIEDGGSVENERILFFEAIDQLIDREEGLQ